MAGRDHQEERTAVVHDFELVCLPQSPVPAVHRSSSRLTRIRTGILHHLSAWARMALLQKSRHRTSISSGMDLLRSAYPPRIRQTCT